MFQHSTQEHKHQPLVQQAFWMVWKSCSFNPQAPVNSWFHHQIPIQKQLSCLAIFVSMNCLPFVPIFLMMLTFDAQQEMENVKLQLGEHSSHQKSGRMLQDAIIEKPNEASSAKSENEECDIFHYSMVLVYSASKRVYCDGCCHGKGSSEKKYRSTRIIPSIEMQM